MSVFLNRFPYVAVIEVTYGKNCEVYTLVWLSKPHQQRFEL